VFKSHHKLIVRITGVLVGGLFLTVAHFTMAETVIDPMQPPAFALNKFRLAKLKKKGLSQAGKNSPKKQARKSLRLSSILIAKDRKVAIINDQMLLIGDRIGTARLVRILKDRVQMSRSGKKIELKLQNVKTTIRKHVAGNKL